MPWLSGNTALQKYKRPLVWGNEVHLIIFKKEQQELLRNTLPTLFFSQGPDRIPVLRHRYFIKGWGFQRTSQQTRLFSHNCGKKMAKAFLSVLFFLSITPIRGGEKKHNKKQPSQNKPDRHEKWRLSEWHLTPSGHSWRTREKFSDDCHWPIVPRS